MYFRVKRADYSEGMDKSQAVFARFRAASPKSGSRVNRALPQNGFRVVGTGVDVDSSAGVGVSKTGVTVGVVVNTGKS